MPGGDTRSGDITETRPSNGGDSARSSGDEHVCFVCFEGVAPRSQCLCVDRHVHDACLDQWLRQSGRSECSVCCEPYGNVDTTHVVGYRLNWVVISAVTICTGVIVLAVSGAVVLAESIDDQHAITLVFGILFFSLIPLLMWFSRDAMRDAWRNGCAIFSFVVRPQTRVRKTTTGTNVTQTEVLE